MIALKYNKRNFFDWRNQRWKPRKFLYVDDESRMRKLVRDFLEKKNFQVLEAGDGEEAMDIFLRGKGYRPHPSGCHDAKDGWMGSVQGDP